MDAWPNLDIKTLFQEEKLAKPAFKPRFSEFKIFPLNWEECIMIWHISEPGILVPPWAFLGELEQGLGPGDISLGTKWCLQGSFPSFLCSLRWYCPWRQFCLGSCSTISPLGELSWTPLSLSKLIHDGFCFLPQSQENLSHSLDC